MTNDGMTKERPMSNAQFPVVHRQTPLRLASWVLGHWRLVVHWSLVIAALVIPSEPQNRIEIVKN
jgi:hypothetical protein